MTDLRIPAILPAALAAGFVLSGCEEGLGMLEEGGGPLTGEQRWVDGGVDSKSLTQLVAGIWVDPTGCDHWIIDDGVEGYLSQRLDPQGRPVCSGGTPNTATGPFKQGSDIPDRQ